MAASKVQPADSVRAIERAAVELCLASEPPSAALEQLGDARIWSLYRHMVRKRLYGEVKGALRRSYRDAGDTAFAEAFDDHMARRPPRARFFHAIVGDFARSAADFFRAHSQVPAHLGDLVEYEAALWAVADMDDRPPAAPLGEFAFDGRPQLAPALMLLRLDHAVNAKRDAAGAFVAAETFLCVHRKADEQKARTWKLNAITHDLMRRFADHNDTVTEAIQAVATARSIAVDETFLDGLCTVLADFIERGIILGCKPA